MQCLILVSIFHFILKTQGNKFLIDRDLIAKKDGFRFNLHNGEGEVRRTGFQNVGCWKDTWNRAIMPLEGTHKLLLDTNYKLREDPLRKCAIVALEKGLKVFALENGGQCFGDTSSGSVYQQFGRANQCRDDGYGGPFSMQVYRFTGNVEPRDGGYSEWSQWTKCSKRCGRGIMKRSRTCTKPRPAHGGLDCRDLGRAMQRKSCGEPCVGDEETGSLDSHVLLSPITETIITPKASSFAKGTGKPSNNNKKNHAKDEDEDDNSDQDYDYKDDDDDYRDDDDDDDDDDIRNFAGKTIKVGDTTKSSESTTKEIDSTPTGLDNTPKSSDSITKDSDNTPKGSDSITNETDNVPKVSDNTPKGSDNTTNVIDSTSTSGDASRNASDVKSKDWNSEIKAAQDILRAKWLSLKHKPATPTVLSKSPSHVQHGSSRQNVVKATMANDDDADDYEEEQGAGKTNESAQRNDELSAAPQEMSQKTGTKRIIEQCVCPAIKCLNLAMDTGVLIDNSNVTEIDDLAEMKAFAKGLAAGFIPPVLPQNIQMGVIAGGMRSRIVVPFDEKIPIEEFNQRVDEIRPEQGPSDMGGAYKRAEAYLLLKQKKAIPPMLNDMVFVMESGDGDADIHAPLKDLKSAGAKIVMIGVGKNAKLGKAASQADKTFMVPPGAGNAIVNAIIAAVCKPDLMGKMIPNPIPCCTPATKSTKRTTSNLAPANSLVDSSSVNQNIGVAQDETDHPSSQPGTTSQPEITSQPGTTSQQEITSQITSQPGNTSQDLAGDSSAAKTGSSVVETGGSSTQVEQEKQVDTQEQLNNVTRLAQPQHINPENTHALSDVNGASLSSDTNTRLIGGTKSTNTLPETHQIENVTEPQQLKNDDDREHVTSGSEAPGNEQDTEMDGTKSTSMISEPDKAENTEQEEMKNDDTGSGTQDSEAGAEMDDTKSTSPVSEPDKTENTEQQEMKNKDTGSGTPDSEAGAEMDGTKSTSPVSEPDKTENTEQQEMKNDDTGSGTPDSEAGAEMDDTKSTSTVSELSDTENTSEEHEMKNDDARGNDTTPGGEPDSTEMGDDTKSTSKLSEPEGTENTDDMDDDEDDYDESFDTAEDTTHKTVDEHVGNNAMAQEDTVMEHDGSPITSGTRTPEDKAPSESNSESKQGNKMRQDLSAAPSKDLELSEESGTASQSSVLAEEDEKEDGTRTPGESVPSQSSSSESKQGIKLGQDLTVASYESPEKSGTASQSSALAEEKGGINPTPPPSPLPPSSSSLSSPSSSSSSLSSPSSSSLSSSSSSSPPSSSSDIPQDEFTPTPDYVPPITSETRQTQQHVNENLPQTTHNNTSYTATTSSDTTSLDNTEPPSEHKDLSDTTNQNSPPLPDETDTAPSLEDQESTQFTHSISNYASESEGNRNSFDEQELLKGHGPTAAAHLLHENTTPITNHHPSMTAGQQGHPEGTVHQSPRASHVLRKYKRPIPVPEISSSSTNSHDSVTLTKLLHPEQKLHKMPFQPALNTPSPPHLLPATSPKPLTEPPLTHNSGHPATNTGKVGGKINKKIRTLSNSLFVLSEKLNKARETNEIREGNFSLNTDIEHLLEYIETLKKQADKIRSSDKEPIVVTDKQPRPTNDDKILTFNTTGNLPLKLQIGDHTVQTGQTESSTNTSSQSESSMNMPSQSDNSTVLSTNQSTATFGAGQPITHQSANGVQPITAQNAKPIQPITAQGTKPVQPTGDHAFQLATPITVAKQNPSQPITAENMKLAQPITAQHTKPVQPITIANEKLSQPITAKETKPAMTSQTTNPDKPSQTNTNVKPLPITSNASASQSVTQWPADAAQQTTETTSKVTGPNLDLQYATKSAIPDCDMNLGFVLDGSASIEGSKRGNFLKMVNFVKDMIHAFAILSRQVHIGTLVYSTKAQVILSFGTKGTEEKIDQILDDIKYPGQGSLTGNALKEAWNQMFVGAPRGRDKVLLLMTDGPSNDDVKKPSEWIKRSGVKMFVVGLGPNYDMSQLNMMASEPAQKHVITKQYDELKTSVQEIRNKLCGFNSDQILQMLSDPSYQRDSQLLSKPRGMFQPNQCIIDVAFLLDGSRQVETNGQGNFQRQLEFVKKAVKFLPLSADDVHVGVGLLGDRDVMVFPINEHYTENSVDFELDHIQFPSAEVVQNQDLKMARDVMLGRGTRDVAPKVIVLVTDVSSMDSYQAGIEKLRSEGSEAILFGIGSFSWKQKFYVRSTVDGFVDQALTLDNVSPTEAVKQFAINLCKLSNEKRSDIPRYNWKPTQNILNSDR